MDDLNLDIWADKIQSAPAAEDAFDLLSDALKLYGFNAYGYQIISHKFSAVDFATGMIHHTFPDSWVELYNKSDYGSIDPIILQALRVSRPLRWKTDLARIKLSQQQKDYARLARKIGLSDGLTIPVRCAMGELAIFSLAMINTDSSPTHTSRAHVHYLCLTLHSRYEHDWAKSTYSNVDLSPREKDVLRLAATGLTNRDIAKELGVTPNTVNTFLKRIFDKLESNNRMSAVLKALNSGLILAD